jgi:hypothetical protein
LSGSFSRLKKQFLAYCYDLFVYLHERALILEGVDAVFLGEVLGVRVDFVDFPFSFRHPIQKLRYPIVLGETDAGSLKWRVVGMAHVAVLFQKLPFRCIFTTKITAVASPADLSGSVRVITD